MLKDNENQSSATSLQTNKKTTDTDLRGVKKLKTLDFDNSVGFVCDINTGICSPVKQEKEGK